MLFLWFVFFCSFRLHSAIFLLLLLLLPCFACRSPCYDCPVAASVGTARVLPSRCAIPIRNYEPLSGAAMPAMLLSLLAPSSSPVTANPDSPVCCGIPLWTQSNLLCASTAAPTWPAWVAYMLGSDKCVHTLRGIACRETEIGLMPRIGFASEAEITRQRKGSMKTL